MSRHLRILPQAKLEGNFKRLFRNCATAVGIQFVPIGMAAVELRTGDPAGVQLRGYRGHGCRRQGQNGADGESDVVGALVECENALGHFILRITSQLMASASVLVCSAVRRKPRLHISQDIGQSKWEIIGRRKPQRCQWRNLVGAS
jgi:hypothetical protein